MFQPSLVNFSGLVRPSQDLGTHSPGIISRNCKLLLTTSSPCSLDVLPSPLFSSKGAIGAVSDRGKFWEREEVRGHSFIHSFKTVCSCIHLFIQQIFIKHLILARHFLSAGHFIFSVLWTISVC